MVFESDSGTFLEYVQLYVSRKHTKCESGLLHVAGTAHNSYLVAKY